MKGGWGQITGANVICQTGIIGDLPPVREEFQMIWGQIVGKSI